MKYPAIKRLVSLLMILTLLLFSVGAALAEGL